MSIYSSRPITLTGLQTYPLSSRKSKVSIKDFANSSVSNPSLGKFLDSLPNLLAAQDLRNLLAAIHSARRQRRPILWGIGGHVIKTGLGPILIELMRRGFITSLAMNGAALVHDFEIALAGNTSEDVEAGLRAGAFGMAAETGEYLNQIAKIAMRARLGYGEAAGQFLDNAVVDVPFADFSVLANAYNLRLPVTVHLGIGTDIPHMHYTADGSALGAASYIDFRLFCSLVQQMHPGGVYLNWGSAVLLPEVFLKAVSVARNLGTALHPITTANFDFIQHYRPLQNVVKRPTASGRGRKGEESRGYAITGHHELLLPLVAAALIGGWPKPGHRPSKAPRRKQPRKKTK
jgi:hypothetical protein